MVSYVDWTLLGSANARRNDQVEAKLTWLHLFLVMITAAQGRGQGIVVSTRALLLSSFATTTHIESHKIILARASSTWIVTGVS